MCTHTSTQDCSNFSYSKSLICDAQLHMQLSHLGSSPESHDMFSNHALRVLLVLHREDCNHCYLIMASDQRQTHTHHKLSFLHFIFLY